MTLFFHELKRNSLSLLIWSCIIAFMLAITVIIYPEMKSQMGELTDMMANMGAFSDAFGMDKLNFGEFIGYFGTECGNVLGLGGAMFAAIVGISAFGKEEKEHTAEFLLAHPISRTHVAVSKLASAFVQIVILNVAVAAAVSASIIVIGEKSDLKAVPLLFLAYFIMQIEIASITFGISAFLKSGGLAMGLGISVMLYFMNIIANLTEEAEFLKYITPFGYTDAGDIISNLALNGTYIAIGMALSLIAVAIAFVKYNKKDIS